MEQLRYDSNRSGGFGHSEGLAGEWQPCIYKISLKLFNITNCATRSSASRASADELLEVADKVDFCELFAPQDSLSCLGFGRVSPPDGLLQGQAGR